MAGAKGSYFWTPEGRRFLDFNSQLMCVNVGHSHPHVVKAIQEQAATLAYTNPFMATAPRARLGAKLAEIAPGDISVFFFTNGGAEANENAIKLARAFTGRHKILARYRSYHGATAGSMSLTGDPRRWANEPGIPGVVHVMDPYHGIQRGWDRTEDALAALEEVIQLEGPATIAGFILETVTGTNGILVPPDGYLKGVRDLCTKYGILMICDEVMSGFGRTGRWFAVDHWNVVPDLLTMAKGLTSAYVPLGAVGMRRHIADHFRDRVFAGGLTYNSHPLACAAALATIEVYEQEDLIGNARRMGGIMADVSRPARRPPSVRGRGPLHWPLRYHRAGPRSADPGADGAVQRHVARDGGARPRASGSRSLHVRAVEYGHDEPSVVDLGAGAAGGFCDAGRRAVGGRRTAHAAGRLIRTSAAC